jgi:hypothetical protein
VDSNGLKKLINAGCPGGVLDQQPFGRFGSQAFWVSARELSAIAGLVCVAPGFHLDWLENLTAFELEGTLVLTYFVRSTRTSAQLNLRASFEMPSRDSARIRAFSVLPVWPMAGPFESEISDLFGVDFEGPGAARTQGDGSVSVGENSRDDSRESPRERYLLPKGWEGFPFRRSYIFPTEFEGIPHLRPVGRSLPDEFGGGA